ncbi:MAG: hypothetical protein U0169_00730 [Polyangiaceae bacterium]
MRTSVLAMAVTFPTHDNGTLVGATRGPTRFCYLAKPGLHEIVVDTGDAEERATLEAKAGATYVLKQEVDNVFGFVRCRALWIAEDEWKDHFDASEEVVLTGVPGDEVLPPNPNVVP